MAAMITMPSFAISLNSLFFTGGCNSVSRHLNTASSPSISNRRSHSSVLQAFQPVMIRRRSAKSTSLTPDTSCRHNIFFTAPPPFFWSVLLVSLLFAPAPVRDPPPNLPKYSQLPASPWHHVFPPLMRQCAGLP